MDTLKHASALAQLKNIFGATVVEQEHNLMIWSQNLNQESIDTFLELIDIVLKERGFPLAIIDEYTASQIPMLEEKANSLDHIGKMSQYRFVIVKG